MGMGMGKGKGMEISFDIRPYRICKLDVYLSLLCDGLCFVSCAEALRGRLGRRGMESFFVERCK